ncbi:MAG TPA: hypothetical protein VFM96_06915 [Gaiellaceae bacterium]|nr:hypothetical protein [Gaiellaceae bacterium]
MRTLDEFLPRYEFSERHRIHIDAAPERIDAVVREIAAEDVLLLRLLFWLRRFGRRPPARRPFVDHAKRLEDVRGEGLVLGLEGDFWRLRRSGSGSSCTAVLDFRVADGHLTTETRVHVADPAARRRFAYYWRVVRPFSGLTRIVFLREAKRRAEASA